MPPSKKNPMTPWRRRDGTRTRAATMAVVVAVVGLLSASSPPLRHRLRLILELVPGVVPTTAAIVLVAVSVLLLLTARGLRRGQRLAWVTALGLLGISALLNLVKGLDVEETAITVASFTWLSMQYDAFAVLPSRAAVKRSALLGGIGVVLVMTFSVLAGLALPDHREGHFEHFVSPVLAVSGVALVIAALWVALSPREPRALTGNAHLAERERARAIVDQYGSGTLDYFALRDDKDWFFVENSVVAHTVRAGVCLVSPDPIGPADEREEVWAEFLHFVASHGWSVAILAGAAQWQPLYEASGLRSVYLGDEAIVNCSEFSLAGGERKSLRQAVSRVAREGYVTTFHDPAHCDEALKEQILAIAAESRQGDAERGFSMTLSRLFDPHDSRLLLSVVQNAEGRVDAFIQWVPAPHIGGWSLDVMRRRLDAPTPNGLMEACIVATIDYIAGSGGRALALNFAVERTLLEGERTGPWARATRPLVTQLSERTQMASLASFNDKFDPEWVPRYVVLDSVEFVATQGLVMADAEGVSEIPVIGRFLGRRE